MREILFRGKRKDNGLWVEGCYCETLRYNNMHWIWDGKAHVWVDPATVGQYTGLTDKNGVKIFEGDIVTGLFLFGMDVPAVVAFRDGAFGLLWQRGNVPEFSAFTSICNIEYEVIGNVHDNPELMEVRE